MIRKRTVSIMIILCLIPLFISGCIEETPSEKIDFFETLDTSTLVGYWSFDGNISDEDGDLLNDISPLRNHGDIRGTNIVSPGKIGNGCGYFDGVDDHIQIQNHPSLEPEYVTIEAWVKSSSPKPQRFIISKGAQDCTGASYAFSTDEDEGLY